MAKERYIDYSHIEKMHYIPKEEKDLNWMRDMLRVMEQNSEPFSDPTKMAQRRAFEKGVRDADEAKRIIDQFEDLKCAYAQQTIL